jgi:tripartite-type tricarboxylate transporter receptor subunit TctC
VVEKLNIELTKILQMPDVVARFEGLGGETGPMTLPEIAKWVQGEVSTWTRLVKEAGIQPE